MSGAHSRRKGVRGEREVAVLLGLQRNARNGVDDGDLHTPANYPYSIEVKRYKRAFAKLYDALEQAESYHRSRTPVAVVRDDRGEWLAVFRLSDCPFLHNDEDDDNAP